MIYQIGSEGIIISRGREGKRRSRRDRRYG
jgi:hypothetical protein